jgi:hypothetical protein
MAHLAAVGASLLAYALLAASYFGWGHLSWRLFGSPDESTESSILTIWLGWAVTLFVFQLFHLFLPITPYVTIPIFGLGLAFSVRPISRRIFGLWLSRLEWPPRLLLLVLFLVLAAYVASKAMLPPTNYDSGLYHLNAIRWINTYPIVPGLGNLHFRLAFNQSFFAYVATLNVVPLFEHGRSLANSFLLLLTLATLTPPLVTFVRRPSAFFREHPFLLGADLLAAPIVLSWILFSNGLSSPSPDLASSLLQLVMFVLLARGIGDWVAGRREQHQRVAILIMLAATAVTIKLSNLAFSAVIMGVACLYLSQTSPPFVRAAVRAFLPASILLLLWVVRGVVLAGVPLFPSTIGYLPFEWAMPAETINDSANWVYSWARLPGAHWRNVLGSWAWLQPWMTRMLERHRIEVIVPLVLALLMCLLTLLFMRVRRTARSPRLEWILLLPTTASLLYWFFTAPEPRFANATIELILISAVLLLLTALRNLAAPRWLTTAFWILFAVSNLHFIRPYAEMRKLVMTVSTAGWHSLPLIPLKRETTESGLAIFVPESGDQCWDAPLPSTPYFNKHLRLIDPQSVSSGFSVKNQAGR